MAKRKNSNDDESDDYEQSEDDNTKVPLSKKKQHSKASERPLTIKKPKIGSTDSPPASSSKKMAADDPNDVKVFTTPEGESYVELGQKKRVTVREFKGKILVDIREFYGKDREDEKPGKKGISLNPDQWDSLKKSINTIDSFFANRKK